LMRIVYMGSPDFAVVPLKAILASNKHQIVGVITQPDRPKGRGKKCLPTPVKQVALEHNLPLLQFADVNQAESVQKIADWQPDLLVVVAFGQLLKQPLLNLAPYGAVNIHASLLPAYRGAAPIHWSIINGETKTGVTTMYMDSGMDTGEIILQSDCLILPEDNVGTLHDKLAHMGADLLLETLDLISQGKAPRIKQDHASATYASLLQKEHELIDWSKAGFIVYNQIRGLAPFPGAYTFYRGKRLKIYASSYLPDLQGPAGIIAALDERGIVVTCAKGAVAISVVQPAGKSRMSSADFIRGYGIKVNERLG
jgi:methionyl-tRNA formyltransferase